MITANPLELIYEPQNLSNMEKLEIFSQQVSEWEKYLEASTDMNNPNWVWAMDEPSPLPYDVKSEMVNQKSTLFKGIGGMMIEKGVENVLRLMVANYFDGFTSFVDRWCNAETMEEHPALSELVLTGTTFLQLLADKAYKFGLDAGRVFSIIGERPRGAGGIDHPARYSLGVDAQGVASHSSSGEFLCNPQEQQKWPQEQRKGGGLATTPNEPQQAAEGQQMGNGVPQQEKSLQDLLPKELKSVEAVAVFQRAIDANMMEWTGVSFKWYKTKALLAYLMGHFLVDGVFPDKVYSNLFGVQRLGMAYYRLADNKHGDGKPRGYEDIDKLFE